MNRICSSLLTNSRKNSGFHQIYRPRYNKEYFKRLLKNVDNLKNLISKRCKDSNSELHHLNLENLKKDARRLVELKEKFEKFEKSSEEDNGGRWEIKDCLEEVEERVLPIVLEIPNRLSKLVPEEDVIVEELPSKNPYKDQLVKLLNYTKLSYINGCYSKSVVGPNSHYYFGIGAKIQHALADFFATSLENKRGFIPMSGICLTKSAILEAVNSSNSKSYTNDASRILAESPSSTALHLVEASRESLIGFVTTLATRTSNNPLRLMTSGAGYRLGTEWFDSDVKRVAQFETLHALCLNSSIEQYSMNEYHETRDLLWSLYRELNLPVRLIHCSIENMHDNEYDAHRIDVWLPSRQSWIEASRVSHYLDYLTVRTGMKRGHFIDAKVYDGQALVSAIIENNQTPTGKFIIPDILKEHMVHLFPGEEESYFFSASSKPEGAGVPSTHKDSMRNYEQRRYLVKKFSLLGHSRRAEKNALHRNLTHLWVIVVVSGIFSFLDLEELYILVLPKSGQRFLYDYCYRPVRRIWWNITYTDSNRIPADIPYDQLDLSSHDKSTAQRKQDIVYSARAEFKEGKKE